MKNKKKKAREVSEKIAIMISTTLVVLVAVFFICKIVQNTNEDVVSNLNNTKIEDLEVGKKYTIDVSDNLGCVWETTMFDIATPETRHYKMYLVPVGSENNTYIGIMGRESSPLLIVSKTMEVLSHFGVVEWEQESSNSFPNIVGKRITGTLKEYDWIMSKKIPEEITEQQIDSSQITIVPMYLDAVEADAEIKWFVICLPIVMVLLMLAFVIGGKTQKKNKFKYAFKEEVMYEKRPDGELTWDETILLEKEDKSNLPKYIFKYRYGDVKEGKSIYDAFKKFYGHYLYTGTLGCIIIFYIVYGIFFSFNPKNWYYGLYGEGIYITYGMAIIFIFLAVALFIIWVVNPMKKSIIRNIRKQAHYSKEHFEACLVTGALFPSNEGYIYVSKDFLIVGDSMDLSIVRYDKVRKIVWCKRRIGVGDNQHVLTWLKIEKENGDIVNVSIKWRTAICFLKYWKKKCNRFFGVFDKY